MRPKGQKYKRGPYNQRNKDEAYHGNQINVEAYATPQATKIQSSNQRYITNKTMINLLTSLFKRGISLCGGMVLLVLGLLSYNKV